MSGDVLLMLAAFGVASSVVFLVAILFGRHGENVAMRVADLSPADKRRGTQRQAPSWLPWLGAMLMPRKASNRDHVDARLVQAGFYRRHATAVFLGTKLLLMVCPLVVGAVLYGLGLLTLVQAMLCGTFVGLAGTAAPGLWIDALKTRRQKILRRSLPDALDVIVICLEGGLSLPAAFGRVTDELFGAYPLLAAEMALVRKEIELGRSTANAFRDFADRFDAEELRSMAVVIGQSERFGASLVRTLRIQADSLRLKRHQYAEAQAQKAPLKLIFPTVLCIFPAFYIVLMGPAGVQLWEMLNNLSAK
jgi:tight adherence protein C